MRQLAILPALLLALPALPLVKPHEELDLGCGEHDVACGAVLVDAAGSRELVAAPVYAGVVPDDSERLVLLELPEPAPAVEPEPEPADGEGYVESAGESEIASSLSETEATICAIWGADCGRGLAIAACESGPDYYAGYGTFAGTFQLAPLHAWRFSLRGWDYWSDALDVYKNSVIAYEIYQEQGTAPWPVCRYR